MREKITFINLYIDTYKLSNICDALDINKKLTINIRIPIIRIIMIIL